MAPNAPLNFISNRFKALKCAPCASQELFSDLDTWYLLNLRPEDVLEIPDRLAREFGISSRFLDSTMEKYIVQSTRMNALYENWDVKDAPEFLIAGTKHYSWPKGVGRSLSFFPTSSIYLTSSFTALAGIGSDNLINIPVDKHARLDLTVLRHALDHCLSEHQAVYAVVATIGTTEEGAVDPIAKIIELREEYQKKGLSFLIHAGTSTTLTFSSSPAYSIYATQHNTLLRRGMGWVLYLHPARPSGRLDLPMARLILLFIIRGRSIEAMSQLSS
jgi:hypothetical protein